MASLNEDLKQKLTKLAKDGKLYAVPDEEAKSAFDAIRKELEPLNRESKLKQFGSEMKARDRFFNI